MLSSVGRIFFRRETGNTIKSSRTSGCIFLLRILGRGGGLWVNIWTSRHPILAKGFNGFSQSLHTKAEITHAFNDRFLSYPFQINIRKFSFVEILR